MARLARPDYRLGWYRRPSVLYPKGQGCVYIPRDGCRPDGTPLPARCQRLPLGLEATRARIPAECGGSCSCATCLVHVDEAWSSLAGRPSAEEEDMLDFAFEVKPTSRLSCQIKVTEAL